MNDMTLMPPPKSVPFNQPHKKWNPNSGTNNPQDHIANNTMLDHSDWNKSNWHTKKHLSFDNHREFKHQPIKKHLFFKKLKKKKSKSLVIPPVRADWDLRDAELALCFENEYNKCKGEVHIKLEFPDEPQSAESVKRLHPNLRRVFPQQKQSQRFCYITLRPGADVDKVLADLNSKPLPEFNGKCLKAELCNTFSSDVRPEDIDPYSLYIGNIPYSLTPKQLIKLFPNKRRIDAGFSFKVKNTRYVFIKFRTLKESIEAFKKALTINLESQNLNIRFKRLKNPRDRCGNACKSECSSVYEEDVELFRFKPEFVPDRNQSISIPNPNENLEDFFDDSYFDPEEYDFDELYPAPRAPRLPLVKFLRSNDEDSSVADYDFERNLPIIPDDLVSHHFSESLHELDSPYQ